jgi:leucyl aminopeptidase (aminopeptidase T)
MATRFGSSIIRVLALAGIVGIWLAPAQAVAQDDAHLAVQLIKTSASVQPGDHVVVFGGKHSLDLMEAVAIEAQKAGGMVDMMLNTDRVARSFWTEVSDEYVGQVPEYWEPWLKTVDVWIGLPTIENPEATFGDVPQERFALGAESGQFFNDMLNSTPLRGVAVTYPTEADAMQAGLDFATYSAMQWAAINADYAAISRHGQALAKMLKGADEVHITSPAGTDIRFSMGNRTVFVDDGIVTPEESKSKLFLERWTTLPGGQVFASIDEGSADGTVVVEKTRCQFKPMTGVRFSVDDGQIRDFSAGVNASCYEEAMAPFDDHAARMGSLSIGLNPHLKVMEDGGADYRPGDAAGMVWLNFGDNQLLGGKNKTTGGYGFPIVHATVTVDGTVLVRDGALVN